jgi:hypothetical protein
VSTPPPRSAAARREAKSRAPLIAAYREGLGLAGIALIRGAAGTRIAVIGRGGDDCDANPADTVAMRWWCRRADDAKRVAVVATTRLRRLESQDDTAKPSMADVPRWPGVASAAVEHAAKRLRVSLYSDDDVSADADRIIARVNEEIETLQRTGQLKSVNQSYRAHRLQAAARGEKAAPYADWLSEYKAKLVRELAAALRYL